MLIAILALSFLIFFHELGHFVVARICGVRVEVFSLGFGKKILSFTHKNTQYALSLIPLGGYVKLKGQDDAYLLKNKPESTKEEQILHDSDSYISKTPLQRIAILFAGPLFNLLLAFILYVIVALNGVPSVLPVVGEVMADSPAYHAKLQQNDKILLINDEKIHSWNELDKAIANSQYLKMQIERDGQILDISITPEYKEGKNVFNESIMRYFIGIKSANDIGSVAFSSLDSLSYAFSQCLESSTLIAQSIYKLINGSVPTSELRSVVGIVGVIDSVSFDIIRVFLIVALISINLCIINLAPIPALDGGHIIFNIYEMITKKPPNEKIAYMLTLCGWAILLALMMLGLFNDFVDLLKDK